MSFDGSGTYTLPAGNPVTTGTTISSTTHNTTMSDVATALTLAVCKDGQSTPSANLPMGTFRHTGVGNPTARTQYASAAGVQDGTLTYLTSVAGTNTITATAAVSMTAYATGQMFLFIPAATNTGATTINLNSIGAKSIFSAGAALVGGELTISQPVLIAYDGTQFNIIGFATTINVATTIQRMTDAGAGEGPTFILDRLSSSPAVNDVLGLVDFRGRDSGGTATSYARIVTSIVDPTDTSEDGALSLQTIVAGTLATRFNVAQGLYANGTTDKGAGAINGAQLYDNGTRIQHEGTAKGWVKFSAASGTPTAAASFNLTSLTDNGVGDTTIVWATDFSSANYVCVGSCGNTGGRYYLDLVDTTSMVAGATQVFTALNDATPADVNIVCVVAFGAQ